MLANYDNIHSRLEGLREPSYIDDPIGLRDRLIRIVSLIGGLVVLLLVVRFLLLFFGLRLDNALGSFINQASSALVLPFFNFFGYHAVYRSFSFEPGLFVAIIGYTIFIWLLTRLLSIWPES